MEFVFVFFPLELVLEILSIAVTLSSSFFMSKRALRYGSHPMFAVRVAKTSALEFFINSLHLLALVSMT